MERWKEGELEERGNDRKGNEKHINGEVEGGGVMYVKRVISTAHHVCTLSRNLDDTNTHTNTNITITSLNEINEWVTS